MCAGRGTVSQARNASAALVSPSARSAAPQIFSNPQERRPIIPSLPLIATMQWTSRHFSGATAAMCVAASAGAVITVDEQQLNYLRGHHRSMLCTSRQHKSVLGDHKLFVGRYDPMYGPAARSKKILTSWW